MKENVIRDIIEVDGVCVSIVEGCTDETALNYNPNANNDDGSCIQVVLGCTDASQYNYDESANTDDGSVLSLSMKYLDESVIIIQLLTHLMDPVHTLRNMTVMKFV